MRKNDVHEKIVIDKSDANMAAIDKINSNMAMPITGLQDRYLNDIVEQDHRAIKRVTMPMLGVKFVQAAAHVLAGVALMHMVRKGTVCH